eukprot:TRINITY_DN221_c0_g4_i1.p1 TRINITY_DN221_c0_g4~~TRINITY_DN221_c0_g4_i1.p1  ORF type:complete len:540 (+),score=147.83 TRINITY_DN221_c0_g4_i1:73-1620(+)
MKSCSLLVSLALFVTVSIATCPSVPRTGCFQSTNVDATIRSNIFGNINAYDWIWTNDGEDYGLTVTYPATGSGNPLGIYLLCVYNGNTVTQTETVAPSTSSQLGSFPAIVGANLDLSSGTPKKIQVQTYGIGRLWAQGVSSTNKAAAITQLIDPTSSKCWSKAIGFVNTNPPPVLGGGYLNNSLANPIINKLAARYNAKSNGQPLNMISFSAALGPADLFQKHATVSLTGFDVRSHLSAFHVLGWYGGLWFLRDGFGGRVLSATSLTLDNLNTVYSSVAELVEAQNPTAFASYIESNVLNPLPTATNDVLRSFGYNTGYSLQVMEFGASLAAQTGNNGYLAPAGALNCQGTHPACTFNPGSLPDCPLPTGTSLAGCSFTPQFIPANNDLQASLTTYKAAFPNNAANLLTLQDQREPVGRQVWLGLSPFILSSPTVYQTLYGVNNAFLETLQTSALLSTHYAVQTPGSAASLSAGTRAALSIGSGTGWLASYGYALSNSNGGLPVFELGTTPITVA